MAKKKKQTNRKQNIRSKKSSKKRFSWSITIGIIGSLLTLLQIIQGFYK